MRQRDDLAFPMTEYQHRLSALRERMAQHEVDLLLITTPENNCYITGYESPGHFRFQAVLIPLVDEPVAIPRQLEESGVQAHSWINIIRPYQDVQDPMAVIRDVLTEFGWSGARIGYERDCWFFTASQQDRLFAHCQGARWIDCSGIVEQGRVVKSAHEIDWMRRASRCAERSMQAGIDAVQAGATENDVAAEMHHALITAGSEWPAIAPFVASGYRGAIGHATWSGRVMQTGDVVMLEVAGCLKRYHSALMRSGFIGEPSPIIQQAEALVLEAFDAMQAVMRAGILASKPDAVAREVLRSGGATQASRSAYSIGIALSPDWGEGHIISMQPDDQQMLQANMIFHVLPWIQIAGQGGISISETVRITEDGCEFLTQFERRIFLR
ncbi:MAG: M24 family metallopeptidase [Anaerolineae bacterium]